MPVIDPLVLVRGVHFVATLLAAGTVSFIVLIAEPASRGGDSAVLPRRLAVVVWLALAAAVASGFAWLVLVAANILDIPLGEAWLGFGPVAVGTRFGVIAGLRLAAALLLGLLLVLPPRQALRLLQMGAAIALTGLLAFAGHAGATPGAQGLLHLASDLAHLLAAAAWLGGLPAFVLMLAAAGPDASPAGAAFTVRATTRFSGLGIASVGVLLASGLTNSLELLGDPAELWTTAYGRVLALKSFLFVLMVGIAAINRFRLTPRLPARASVTALRRNALIETALGFAVVMLVGALGTMVPGGHVHTNTAPPSSEAAFVHIHTEAVMVDVTIAPGYAGKSVATIRLMREDSQTYEARDIKLVLEAREGGTRTPERSAVPASDGTWTVENLQISHSGVWTLRLSIDSGGGPPLLL
ncbi:MAG TPA: copper homeostasis membrane protein CopD, partial [Rhizomicrobium sp.]